MFEGVFNRRFFISPVLLALILATFFSSALSRHQIRHHRNRFKRQQGANLYLPESYVLDGGEGTTDAGPWTDWSAPTPCSRTCGGGVATQNRECQPGYICQGPTMKHFSCNTQDCPDIADFRAQQCSEFDAIQFEGVLYQWVPYTKAPNPCELNCMPRGERFYFRHKAMVIDGTRCSDESLDVCVQGKCQPVGCDMMLGSAAREDKCRQCGGDGSTCNTISGLLDNRDLQVGYSDIFQIPSGATNIKVEEVAPSNNYLAVRNTSGYYHLNGNWRIDFPRTVQFSSCNFHYERYPQGFPAPDKITCLGPTDESLFVVLLSQEPNVGVSYEYSLPKEIQSGLTTENYAWTFDGFTPCSASCGGGVQSRNVSCAGRESLEPVDKNLCDASTEPQATQRCGETPCEATWVPYPWSNCSVPCGETGGVQTREVFCTQIISNGNPSLVDNSLCEHLPRPPNKQACNQGKVCASWYIDPWKPCDHLCGEGKQTRKVHCYMKVDHKITILGDDDCLHSEPKPTVEKKCNVRPCEGVDWVTSKWSGCESSCGPSNETRKAQCASQSGQIYPEEVCEKETKPEIVRECDTSGKVCKSQWYASQWSECSANCGEGVQTRTLFCGEISANGTVIEIAIDKCDGKKKYETMRNCTGEIKECPGEWFTGPWNECSKECGGGEKSRKVLCIKNGEIASPTECGSDNIAFAKEDCNAEACSEDTILPVDVTKPINETPETSEATEATESSFETTSETQTDISTTSSTEPEKLEEEEDEDYEIVPDNECLDGEFVDEESDEPEKEPTSTTWSETEETSSGSTEPTSESSPFSLDDVMLSDATSPSDDSSTSDSGTSPTVVGSGDTDLTSEGTTVASSEPTGTDTEITGTTDLEEGSGGSTIIFTTSSDDDEGTTIESSSTISSDSTTEVTDDSSSSVSTIEETSSSESSTLTEESSPSSTETSETTASDYSESTTEISSTVETTLVDDLSTTPTSDSSDGTTLQVIVVNNESDAGREGDNSTDDTTQKGTTSSDEEVSESTTEVTATSEVSVITTEGSTTSSDDDDEVSASSTEVTATSEVTTEVGTTSSSDDVSTATTEGSTEFDIWSSSMVTTEESASTEESESTEETTLSSSSDLWSSTTSSSSTIEDFFSTTPRQRMCRRRKQPKNCKTTKYGCCWDKITPAEGPFDKNCPTPKTCKESKYGCCEDGVSAALGPKNKGCPSTHCNETLFGCCDDNKTPSGGNNKEGCPPPPPKCLKSKYGCCSNDNTTAAKGPKQKGCTKPTKEIEETIGDCSNSTYGCCPDGKKTAKGEYFKGCDIFKKNCNESYFRCCPDGTTSAKGPNFKGCELPCANSTYGCCQDGVTPAHGYSSEGCCLAGPFGCCPDNITPARGASLEGCGCQYTGYGCCPDNSTIARGHNNEGCGCQYTQHGCCPDNYTPANGPDFAGCLCHTFQFGCCPDGVSEAKGPHQQGCGCRNAEFGCCSDEETPAQGPNNEGCGCESTKYGCCPDGRNEAKGESFEGCENVPINLQDSCTLSKERGPCRNYTVKWYYDMDYGGCSRFWYGGCDGNDNRFKGKEDCEAVCVTPIGYERCNLPKVPGPCDGNYAQWYYDKERKQCTQFYYGGCLGNNNRFETMEECAGLCVKDTSIDACEQKKEEGPCHGQFRKWFFDKETGRCQEFAYGGCKGNNNNFATEQACQQKCAAPGRRKDHCSLPRAQGNCTEKLPKWYYDTPEKRCMPFYYSGCGANKNNFESRDACEADCPKDIEKDLCHLAPEVGDCANYVTKWYYDTKMKACNRFYYGGCGGNGNNFEEEELCQRRCVQSQQPPPEPERPQPQPQPEGPQQPEQPPGEPFRQEMCLVPSESGPCTDNSTRFFYDRSDGVCKSFVYGGCGGNRNNFESAEVCYQYCANSQDICSLPPVVGPCSGTYEQFYFDRASGTCRTFVFGGCEGNYNRFQDQASCEQTCRRAEAPPPQPEPQPPPGNLQDPRCSQTADPGNCTDQYASFFFDPNTRRCTPFTYTGCGGNLNRYNSEEQCERQCGEFREQDVCNLPQDTGPCRSNFVKFYFDRNTGRCEQFVFGGCQGNGNRFSSYEECEYVCVTRDEKKTNSTSTAICELGVDQGSCNENNHKRWYFDNARGQCVVFIYSGCGGNMNNFKTFQHCQHFCRDYIPQTEPPPVTNMEPHPCQAYFDECPTIRCPYGIEPYVDDNQCNRCRCLDPCTGVPCAEGTQCAIDFNRNRTTNQDPNFVAICRPISKEGQCPNIQQNEQCEQECRNDADCANSLKCCSTGCGTACVNPVPNYDIPGELVTHPYLPAYTEPPLVQAGYYPPQVQEEFEPQVAAELGGHVTLHCAIQGNPTPRIGWSKDNLVIDGTKARYRIKLDQSLQIITLHKTDSGIYLCTADNKLGEPIRKEIRLDVVDVPERQASVLPTDEPPNVIASLNAPATLDCYALGYPFPAVSWWKEDQLLPINTNAYQLNEDYSLLINSVQLHNLGVYTCQAYNGVGKAASWSVTVQAKGPYYSSDPNDQKYMKYIINPPEAPVTTERPQWPFRPNYPYRPTPQEYYPPVKSYTEPSPEIDPNEIKPFDPSQWREPVRVNVSISSNRVPVGGDIMIPCYVSGYPTPTITWYKDGVKLEPSERVQITELTLTVRQASKADSGTYDCEARNQYESNTSSVPITVEGMNVHPSCTDNPFFANCQLIVRAKYCSHKYYAKFCCRSCTEAGLLPIDGPHLFLDSKQDALTNNSI